MFGLVGMCCWEFEIGPIRIPTFHEKVTHSYTNLLDLGQNFDQNYLIFFSNSLKFQPILTQISEKMEKTTHSYTKFCIK